MGRPVVHFEIEGRDGKALASFYSELFGWEIFPAATNPAYQLISRDGNITDEGIGIGGAISSVPARPSTSWRGPTRDQGYLGHVTIYVQVPDVEAALTQAESLGATRTLGPDLIPEGPEIGAFTDPEGHLIGVVNSTPAPRISDSGIAEEAGGPPAADRQPELEREGR